MVAVEMQPVLRMPILEYIAINANLLILIEECALAYTVLSKYKSISGDLSSVLINGNAIKVSLFFS